MVVIGDGTLMSMSTALEKPIETILSGPAASIIGATVGGWLTRVEAADIHTYGLGGDSYLRVNKDKNLLLDRKRSGHCQLWDWNIHFFLKNWNSSKA